MRLVALFGLVLCAPSFAQELNINGYSKVVIPRSQGDYVNYNASLRDALRDTGFELHRSVEEIPREAWPKTLYMTAGMADIAPPSVYIAVYDVATQVPIATCVRDLQGRAARVAPPGRGSGLERFVDLAFVSLIEDMGYQGFEQKAYEANLRVRNFVGNATEHSTSPAAPASPDQPRMTCGAGSLEGARRDQTPKETR